ncbi:MAG: desulfoferrodoxin family protein [Phycisphaerae bacterium]
MRGQKMRLYKCPVCDTVVDVLEECGLEIVCCGPAMKLLSENCADDNAGSHRAVVKWTADGLTVSIGDPLHPCKADHYIAWIEAVVGRKCYRQFLGPSQSPRVTFHIPREKVTVRAYCTVHGLWSLTAAGAPSSAGACDHPHGNVLRQAV